MKLKLLFISLFLFSAFSHAQAVDKLWTNYDGLWSSEETSFNPVLPDNNHELLAFRYGTTVYSTGVDDQVLTDNSVTHTSAIFRALPVSSLPTTGGSSYYIGFGQLADGIDNGTDNGSTNPFNAIVSGSDVAQFLTDGQNGLELGTDITNIPQGTVAEFALSSNGITLANINDNVPDILVSQTAQPSGTGSSFDLLYFVDNTGTTVGNEVQIDFTAATEPALGEWNPDFYNFDSTGNSGGSLTNSTRPIHLKAIEITEFGITAANYQDAVELRYEPRGSSDPSFIAFNEPSLGVASQLNILSQPVIQDCDGSLPSNITVQLEDDQGAAVPQAGITISARLFSGPGDLLGTLTQTTDGTGVATFNDLSFSVGAAHKIEFFYASLDSSITTEIADATGCTDYVWNGNTDSQWSVPTNWTPNGVPDGNNAITIPNGRPNYPILTADAGAGDLTMESATSIDLNGYLLALNGGFNITTGASIDASADGSTLYMSSSTAQNIPADLLEPSVANFVVENSGGVTLNSAMDITESLSSLDGTLTTGGFITMKCSFGPPATNAVILEVKGIISGDITTEQCYPARRAFRMVSPSVTTTTSIRQNWQENPDDYLDATPNGFGTHITGVQPGSTDATVGQDNTNGLDYNPSGNPSIFYFDNANQGWETQSNTTTNLVAGEPYRLLIRGDRTIDITDNQTPATDTRLRESGTVQTNTQTLTGFNSTAGAFNFFGNPYHAQVNINEVFEASTNVNKGVIYYWDPTLNTEGGYVTVDLPEGTNSVSSEANQLMQVKQGAFFLTSSQGTAPEIVFNEANKSKSSSQLSVFSAPAEPNRSSYVNIKLYSNQAYQNSEKPYDGLRINFSDKFSNSTVDDYPKLGNKDENLARLNNGFYSAIEYRAMPQNEEALNLFINNYRTSDYQLVIDVSGDLDKELYIVDNYLNQEIEVSSNYFVHAFEVDANITESIDANRFELKFREVALNTNNPELSQIKLYPNPVTANSVVIQGLNSNANYQLEIFDNLGRQVYNQTITNQSQLTLNQLNFETGVYHVKVSNQQTSNNQTIKLIIKQ